MTWRSIAVASLVLAAASPAAAGVDRDQFLLRNGGDLVALCGVEAADPLRTQAVHMCEGFAMGVYRTIQAVTRHEGLQPLFCPPDPPPTRDAAIAAFVAWGRQRPERQTDSAVDFVGRYILETWPCPKTGPAASSSR